MILTSDWHLDDNPQNKYRWAIFERLREQIEAGERVIYMLGDICEHKDKHSAALVNRVFKELCALGDCYAANFGVDEDENYSGLDLTFMLGNHDKPLAGEPYWALLDHLGLPTCFITVPTTVGNQLFLPYSADPATEWATLDFTGIKVAFIHQTLAGAKAEGAAHRVMDGKPGIPKFPNHIKVYSGDIHMPQIVRWGAEVTYVGSPHRVRYGDEHITRMLRLDDTTYEITEEIILDSPAKSVVEISSLQDLQALGLHAEDMVRIRFVLPPDKIESYAKEEAAIKAYAASAGFTLAGIEPIVERAAQPGAHDIKFDTDPLQVYREFAAAEDLDAGLVAAGLGILKAEGIQE